MRDAGTISGSQDQGGAALAEPTRVFAASALALVETSPAVSAHRADADRVALPDDSALVDRSPSQQTERPNVVVIVR